MAVQTAAFSVDASQKQGSIVYLTFVCVVSALGGLLFGFDTVVISGTVTSVTSQFELNEWLKGLFVAAALVGCMLGAGGAGSLSDAFGRKKVLILSSVLFLATGFGCAIAWDKWSLLIFRFIGGMGIGVASMVCPLYISEISPANLRGRMVTLFQFAITIGICLSLFSNAALESLSRAGAGQANGGWYQWIVVDQVWRSMFLAATIPSIAFAILTLFIPESPRWLVKSGKEQEARGILTRVAGKEAASRSMDEIQATIAEETGTLSELFRPGLRKALFVALFLSMLSEFSGVTVVLYYGPDILNNAGVKLGEALGGFVVIGIVNMVFTVIALWLMDHAGRRPLLFWGNLGCCLALASIGGLFATGKNEGVLVVGLICLFMACFAFSIGPIKWVIMSEIFPTRIRGRAVAIATVAVWLADAIYNVIYPWAERNLGVATCFFVFAGVLVPQFFFSLWVMPETKGRTLEEIEKSWTHHK
jgi:MFS transporter, SP family, arabinose:H+ symporter